jgi:hypothetical protein
LVVVVFIQNVIVKAVSAGLLLVLR